MWSVCQPVRCSRQELSQDWSENSSSMSKVAFQELSVDYQEHSYDRMLFQELAQRQNNVKYESQEAEILQKLTKNIVRNDPFVERLDF